MLWTITAEAPSIVGKYISYAQLFLVAPTVVTLVAD